jgi:hypothetical protein
MMAMMQGEEIKNKSQVMVDWSWNRSGQSNRIVTWLALPVQLRLLEWSAPETQPKRTLVKYVARAQALTYMACRYWASLLPVGLLSNFSLHTVELATSRESMHEGPLR